MLKLHGFPMSPNTRRARFVDVIGRLATKHSG
jgi:hypothetical protein